MISNSPRFANINSNHKKEVISNIITEPSRNIGTLSNSLDEKKFPASQ